MLSFGVYWIGLAIDFRQHLPPPCRFSITLFADVHVKLTVKVFCTVFWKQLWRIHSGCRWFFRVRVTVVKRNQSLIYLHLQKSERLASCLKQLYVGMGIHLFGIHYLKKLFYDILPKRYLLSSFTFILILSKFII